MSATAKPAVLVVEPDALVRQALRDALRQVLGSEVDLHLADRGEEALRLAQQLALDGLPLHVVITEQLMPGLRGDALIEALHQINPDTRAIVVSAEADATTLRKLVNRGRVDHLLGKPWDGEVLSAAITQALNAYDERQLERGRLDLVEAATDAALALAAAPTEAALAQQLIELAVSYTGAWGALLAQVPLQPNTNNADASDAPAEMGSVQLRAALVPERGLFDVGADDLARRLPVGLVQQLGVSGGWRRHPSAGSAAEWAGREGELPREAFAIRLYASADVAWVLVIEALSKPLHRAPAALFTRLIPWVQQLLPKLNAQAALHTQLATATASLAELTAQQEQRKSTLTATEGQLQQLRAEMTAALEAQVEANARLQADLEEASALSTDVRKQLEQEKADVLRELDASQQSLSAREAELAVLSAQQASQAEQVEGAQRQAAARIASLEAELAQVSSERRELLDDLARTSEQLGRTEDQSAALKGELERQRHQAEQQAQSGTAATQALQASHAAALANVQGELEQQRLAHQHELSRLARAQHEANQQLQDERNALRNQVLGLTAQLQGAGRPQGQETGPLREQLQALAVKLAETESQLEDAYRQAAAAAQLRGVLPTVRRYFPQSVAAWRGGRPFAQQQLWAGALEDRVMVAVMAAPQSTTALQYLASLEALVQEQYWAAVAHPAMADPSRWLSTVKRAWAAQQGSAGQAALQLGLALFDTEALTVRFAGEGAGLLLWRRGTMVPIRPEQAGASGEESGGLLIEAEDRFVLATDLTLPVADRGAWAPLVEQMSTWGALGLDEQQARLEAYVRQRNPRTSEAGYAALYLSI